MAEEKETPFELNLQLLTSPLEQIREHLGLSRTQLAEKLGVDYETVLRWESGKQVPRLTWEQAIAMEELLESVGLRLKDVPRLGPEFPTAYQSTRKKR